MAGIRSSVLFGSEGRAVTPLHYVHELGRKDTPIVDSLVFVLFGLFHVVLVFVIHAVFARCATAWALAPLVVFGLHLVLTHLTLTWLTADNDHKIESLLLVFLVHWHVHHLPRVPVRLRLRQGLLDHQRILVRPQLVLVPVVP